MITVCDGVSQSIGQARVGAVCQRVRPAIELSDSQVVGASHNDSQARHGDAWQDDQPADDGNADAHHAPCDASSHEEGLADIDDYWNRRWKGGGIHLMSAVTSGQAYLW